MIGSSNSLFLSQSIVLLSNDTMCRSDAGLFRCAQIWRTTEPANEGTVYPAPHATGGHL